MKGGLFNDSTQSNGWLSSLTQGATNLWNKTKNAATNATSSLSSYTSSSAPNYAQTTAMGTPNYSQQMTTTSPNNYQQGGKTKKRRMKGGFKDNTPTTGLAAHAAPFSGPTAQPHNWVGGKTRRHRRKTSKGRKNRTH